MHRLGDDFMFFISGERSREGGCDFLGREMQEKGLLTWRVPNSNNIDAVWSSLEDLSARHIVNIFNCRMA